MAGMIRILFPFIGFLCTASVITLVLGFGYLRNSGMLDDEKMFRIVSLIHGVDMDEIAQQQTFVEEDVPQEETSYQQEIEHSQIARLQLQAKQDDIDKNIVVFQDLKKTVSVDMARYQALKGEVEEYLRQREERARQSGLQAVAQQLESLIAKKQGKPLLVGWLSEGRIDDVILLLNRINPRTRQELIRTFDTPEDVQMLKKIYEQMLSGHPEKTFIEQKLQDLQKLNQDL